MERRRSPRLHPQIQASEEGAGTSLRRSPRLHPQIQPREEGAGMTSRIRRRRGTSPPAAASLPDDDDMLREILLRLPPQPSSLPRVSAVCKRWLGLVTDPKFHRQFYAHHRKPPLLGIFQSCKQGIVFIPVLDPPDRVPLERFNRGRCSSSGCDCDCYVLDCHHGLVLLKDLERKEVVVCDPITGEQCQVSIPPEFKSGYFNGAILCTAGDVGHVHGGCLLGPFKVVLMSVSKKSTRKIACVYSSQTGIWGNLIATEVPFQISSKTAAHVGNCLYWLGHDIVEFDLDENSLTVIRGPPLTNDTISYGNRQIIQVEDGRLGYGILSYHCFKMWRRNAYGHGVAALVPWKTIDMHTICGLPSLNEGVWTQILGYDEDTDVVFLYVVDSVYMVQIKSMQSKKIYGILDNKRRYFPFKSFYTPGTAIPGGSDGAEILHDT